MPAFANSEVLAEIRAPYPDLRDRRDKLWSAKAFLKHQPTFTYYYRRDHGMSLSCASFSLSLIHVKMLASFRTLLR